MSLMYFKGDAGYFDVSFLVGKAFNVIISMDFKKKKTSAIVFRYNQSSKLDFMYYVIDFTQCEGKFFMSIVEGKVFQQLCKPNGPFHATMLFMQVLSVCFHRSEKMPTKTVRPKPSWLLL